MDTWIDQARKQREINFEPKYGPIRPRSDKRCFRREMIEELLDSLNYAEWARMKGEINRPQWKWLSYNIGVALNVIESACENHWWWKLEALRPLDEETLNERREDGDKSISEGCGSGESIKAQSANNLQAPEEEERDTSS